MRNLRGLVVALSFGLSACAGPQGQLFSQVATTIPPLPPDRTRIYFYRDYEPYDSLSRAAILLNGAPAGVSSAGAVFFRDLPPAAYEIAVPTPGSDCWPLMIVTRPGETVYVKVESLRAWQSGGADSNYERDTFVAVNMDPAQAQRELALLATSNPGGRESLRGGANTGAVQTARGSVNDLPQVVVGAKEE